MLVATGCLVWFVQASLLLRHISRLRTVVRLDVPEPSEWPTVSALIPARNEEATLQAALTSRLGDDYTALQVIVIDDRSTDSTRTVIARAAESDPRVVPAHVDGLPDGWLGKVHALSVGVPYATGEWLLISDADVHMTPGGLRRAVAYCLAEDLDFLALVPEFRSHSFVINVLWTVFMRVLGTFVDPAKVRDPHSAVAMGSGAFMLLRKEVFERTEGFAHLKLETTDDIAIGLMMKRAGARCDFANGYGIARISIYGSLSEFYRGVEKNAGSLARTPFPVVVAALAVAGAVELSPLAALAVGSPAVVVLGGCAYLAATVAAVTALRVNTRMMLPAFLWPVGWVLVASGILRAAWLFARRGGVVWRGTFHSREELIGGQRFRLL